MESFIRSLYKNAYPYKVYGKKINFYECDKKNRSMWEKFYICVTIILADYNVMIGMKLTKQIKHNIKPLL